MQCLSIYSVHSEKVGRGRSYLREGGKEMCGSQSGRARVHTDGGVIDRRVLLSSRHAAAAPALRNVSTKYVQ